MLLYPQIEMGERGSIGGVIRGWEPGTEGRRRSVSRRMASRRGRLSMDRGDGSSEAGYKEDFWVNIEDG
jgi:hypothetical protein